MTMTASEMLRCARRSADLSQRDLARAAGVGHAAIGRIESNRVQPTLATLSKLLAAAGCDLVVVRRSDRSPLQTVHDGLLRDRARRRYPPHLDVRVFPAYRHGRRFDRRPVLATFYRRRSMRDLERYLGHVDVRAMPSVDELYAHLTPSTAGWPSWIRVYRAMEDQPRS